MEQTLQDMGLGEKEIAVLLVLFQYGSRAVSFIASKANINRATAYSVLRSLVEKKLVYQTFKGEVTQFAAHDPEAILSYLDTESQKLKSLKSKAKTIIPKLRSLEPEFTPFKVRLKYFEGVEGMRELCGYVFKSQQKILKGVFSFTEFSQTLGEDFVDKFKRKIEKNGLDFRLKSHPEGKPFLCWDGEWCAFWGSESEPFGMLLQSRDWAAMQEKVYELWPES